MNITRVWIVGCVLVAAVFGACTNDGHHNAKLKVASVHEVKVIRHDLTSLSRRLSHDIIAIDAELDTTNAAAYRDLAKIKSAYLHHKGEIAQMVGQLDSGVAHPSTLVEEAHELALRSKIESYRLRFRRQYAYR